MKKILLTALFILGIGMLSGCSMDTGFFHDTFVQPFTIVIQFFATLFGDNYGWSIVAITFLIRLALSPFFIKMQKGQQDMQEKMRVVQPEIKEIQEKVNKTEDPKEKQQYQQEMMALYQKHGINPLNMGCLPMLLQMPVIMGFYYAIRTSDTIASHHFLWFSLGHTDVLLALIACAVYLIHFLVTQIGQKQQQQKNNSMKWIGLISPLFILIISLNYPAALPLYWTVSGLFMIGQTLVSKTWFQTTKPTETPVEQNS